MTHTLDMDTRDVGAGLTESPATPTAHPFDATCDRPGPGVTLLEASAGTGKTYTITSQVLRLVAEEGCMPERILVVTFTEAATTELRERIRTRLRAARDAFAAFAAARADGQAPPPARTDDAVVDDLLAAAAERGATGLWHERLRAALERFDDAAISTIHGFCARVLREHAFACGSELGAELLGAPNALLDETVRDFWDTVVARQPVAVVGVLREEHGLSVETLRDVAERAVREPEAVLEPAVADDAPIGVGCAEALTRLDAARRAHATRWLAERAELLADVERAVQSKALKRASWQERHVAGRVEKISRWAEAPDLEELPEALPKYFTSAALGGSVSHPLVALGDAVAGAEQDVRAAAARDAIAIRYACATFVRRELPRRLRERRAMTYGDLLRGVRDAVRDPVRGPAVLAALRGAYDVALVDEFQDTDGVQWDIFGAAFGEPSHRLVVIGDPKQAIYGFRGADVYAYQRAAGTAAARGALQVNRRSDAPYVEALNHLFGTHAQPFVGPEIPYVRVRAHHAARLAGGGAPFQVRVLRRGPHLKAGKGGGPAPKGAVNARIPALVAADVVRFLASGAEIEERHGDRRACRPVRPSDVAVLVRKNAQAVAVQRALRSAGVPCVIHSAQSVFATAEGAELATVLAAVLEPANASLTRAALATDLLGVVLADELFADGRPAGAGDALGRLDADEGAVDRWVERLRDWRDLWHGATRRGARGAGFARMFRAVVDGLALPARLLALDGGERRLTNLLHLGELLHAESAARALEPGALLAWLRRQMAEEDREDDARQLRLESDADAAQVVTMHASKGLEYAAVWCPYLWDGARASDRDKAHPLYWDADDDGGTVRKLHLAPEEGGEEHERLDDESFAEGLRLLYVALTRARHRCTVWWGAVNEGGASPLGWLFHGRAATGARGARAQCADALAGIADDALRARLDEIARASRGTVAVVDETFEPPTRWTADVPAAASLAAREVTRSAPLDDGWRLGSFTGLTRAAAARYVEANVPEAAADARPADSHPVDAHAGDPPPELADAADDAVPLAEFPASAQAGVFFHDVLEAYDPGPDPASAGEPALDALVGSRLEAFGFDRAAWQAPVAATIRRVIETPLACVAGGPPLVLRDVPRDRRIAELRFELPACGGLTNGRARPITADALARVFEEHPGGALGEPTLREYAARVRALGFRPLRGFLTGALDLLAEHGGRWWVIDWKSNRLGTRAGDYAPERLTDEMTHAHYVLQYHLYLLAVHRWLAWRLPGYDYDAHVAGACYPFLRGVSGAMAPDGIGTYGVAAHGVFVDRPPRARIEALDRLFAEGAA